MTYSFLYSVYALPNIILPLISGILIDKVGDSFMTLILSLFILLGWALFTLGMYCNLIPIMILGRFLQGVGGESQYISI